MYCSNPPHTHCAKIVWKFEGGYETNQQHKHTQKTQKKQKPVSFLALGLHKKSLRKRADGVLGFLFSTS